MSDPYAAFLDDAALGMAAQLATAMLSNYDSPLAEAALVHLCNWSQGVAKDSKHPLSAQYLSFSTLSALRALKVSANWQSDYAPNDDYASLNRSLGSCLECLKDWCAEAKDRSALHLVGNAAELFHQESPLLLERFLVWAWLCQIKDSDSFKWGAKNFGARLKALRRCEALPDLRQAMNRFSRRRSDWRERRSALAEAAAIELQNWPNYPPSPLLHDPVQLRRIARLGGVARLFAWPLLVLQGQDACVGGSLPVAVSHCARGPLLALRFSADTLLPLDELDRPISGAAIRLEPDFLRSLHDAAVTAQVIWHREHGAALPGGWVLDWSAADALVQRALPSGEGHILGVDGRSADAYFVAAFLGAALPTPWVPAGVATAAFHADSAARDGRDRRLQAVQAVGAKSAFAAMAAFGHVVAAQTEDGAPDPRDAPAGDAPIQRLPATAVGDVLDALLPSSWRRVRFVRAAGVEASFLEAQSTTSAAGPCATPATQGACAFAPSEPSDHALGRWLGSQSGLEVCVVVQSAEGDSSLRLWSGIWALLDGDALDFAQRVRWLDLDEFAKALATLMTPADAPPKLLLVIDDGALSASDVTIDSPAATSWAALFSAQGLTLLDNALRAVGSKSRVVFVAPRVLRQLAECPQRIECTSPIRLLRHAFTRAQAKALDSRAEELLTAWLAGGEIAVMDGGRRFRWLNGQRQGLGAAEEHERAARVYSPWIDAARQPVGHQRDDGLEVVHDLEAAHHLRRMMQAQTASGAMLDDEGSHSTQLRQLLAQFEWARPLQDWKTVEVLTNASNDDAARWLATFLLDLERTACGGAVRATHVGRAAQARACHLLSVLNDQKALRETQLALTAELLALLANLKGASSDWRLNAQMAAAFGKLAKELAPATAAPELADSREKLLAELRHKRFQGLEDSALQRLRNDDRDVLGARQWLMYIRESNAELGFAAAVMLCQGHPTQHARDWLELAVLLNANSRSIEAASLWTKAIGDHEVTKPLSSFLSKQAWGAKAGTLQAKVNAAGTCIHTAIEQGGETVQSLHGLMLSLDRDLAPLWWLERHLAGHADLQEVIQAWAAQQLRLPPVAPAWRFGRIVAYSLWRCPNARAGRQVRTSLMNWIGAHGQPADVPESWGAFALSDYLNWISTGS